MRAVTETDQDPEVKGLTAFGVGTQEVAGAEVEARAAIAAAIVAAIAVVDHEEASRSARSPFVKRPSDRPACQSPLAAGECKKCICL